MHSSSTHRSLLTALLALTAAGSSAFADTFYWKGGDGIAATGGDGGNWYTTAAGTTFADIAPDSSSADLFFNRTSANSLVSIVTVDTNFTANSLTFSNTLATTLVQNATNRTLNLGAGGMTMNSGAGAVTIGTNAHDPALTVQVTDDQTWTNSSINNLTVRRLKTATDAGATSVTINAASSGAITVSTGITDTVADSLAIVINSASTGLVTFSGVGTQNNYRGGTTIKSGALSTFGSLGSGAVLLGDTTGNSAATLNVRTSSGFSNNITIQSGSTGIKTLTTNQTGGVVLNGTLTLNDNVAFTASTDGTFNGAISGTGDFVKGGNGALTFSGANTSSGDLTINTGAFTLTETTGSLTFYIGANGVTNQVNGTTTGAVAFNGTFNINLTSANLTGGNSWTLVSLASTAETYGTNFALTGFTQNNNIWTNGTGFTFSESTGQLTYSAVPEPSTFALLGGLTTLLFASARRRRTRA